MIGTRLGAYEITAKLGEGGMGEVYRATDSKLKREVAVKVLPAAFGADQERLARFEREAQLLAQLQHPHIAAIYGLEEAGGVRALVMELVEGDELSALMGRGALPLEEALAIARQIAEALEAAHEHGIVHRDLKPANVKVRSDGTVKVLDFGLAKAMDAAAGSSLSGASLANSPTLMNSPTLTGVGTQLGVILGTAAYMSPEQARGLAVDKRADIWALGVVLHEMLTGQRLFAGETVSDTMAAVLRGEIDLGTLPAATPPRVRQLLRRCLERNAKLRLRDVGEARIALDPARLALPETPAARVEAVHRPGLVVRALPWVLVALLALGLAWALQRTASGGSAAAPRTAVLALHLPGALRIPLDNQGLYGQTAVLAIAPDGRRLAFVEGLVGKGSLYVRDIDDAELRQIEGTTGASSPFFSPDGRWIAYFSPGKLRKVPIDGGRPIDLAEASLDRGGVWGPDGSIVYAATATSGLLRLPPAGGTPEELTQVDVARGERTHRWPALLPGGREVAFTVGLVGQPGNYDDAQIDAVDLATGKRRTLLRGASMVRFTSNGVALLGRDGQVLALRLADLHGQRADEARPVLSNVAGVASSGIVHFDVARDGTLVYAEGDPRAAELELAWLQQDGEAEPLSLPRGEYRTLRFAPGGGRVAMAIGPGGGRGGDVAVFDLSTGALTRLTFDARSTAPVWTADGKSVIFAVALPSGDEEFRERAADGSREAVVVQRFAGGRRRTPVAWMPDGSLLFWEDAGAGSAGNIVYLPPGGGEALPFARTPAIEIGAAVSPDRRYVAYTADATGEQQVFVQPFPPNGAKWLVAEQASTPLWSADGRELYFFQGRAIKAVPVSTTPSFSAGTPRLLFEWPVSAAITDDTDTNFDVAPDGRFLAVRSTSTEPTGGHLVVVLGWFEKLEQLMAERSR